MTIAMTSSVKTRNVASAGISESILTPAMRDFWAGMRFLHRYAARCHADTEAIGRNNLRLLHNTLMADTHYRAILAEAGRCISQRGLPVSHKLFSTVEINAEILSLRQGGSLRLSSQLNQLSLLMVLSGRANHIGAEDKPQSFSRKMHRWLTRSNDESPHILKSEDVIWEKQSGTGPHVMTATSNVCVVLRVRLPLSALSATGCMPDQKPSQRIAVAG
jgi:hypothetical protein